MTDEVPALMQFTSHGVKCDAPGCDYETSEGLACPDDYGIYVDKPCPKCGASLLTPEDFRALQVTQPMLDLMNAVAAYGMTDDELASALASKPVEFQCGSDGKGGIDLGVVKVRVTRD